MTTEPHDWTDEQAQAVVDALPQDMEMALHMLVTIACGFAVDMGIGVNDMVQAVRDAHAAHAEIDDEDIEDAMTALDEMPGGRLQ